MTLVALTNALLAKSHGRAFSRGAARPGDRDAAAGTRAARRGADRATAARRNARRRARTASSPVRRFRAPHTDSPHTQFLSNGTLRHLGDERGRGRKRLARARGDAVAPRRHTRRGRAVRVSARRAQRRGVVGDLSPFSTGARRVRRHVLSRPRHFSAARRRNLDAAGHRGVDRRRRRGAPDHRPQPWPAHPRDRRDELRGDRPDVGGERPRPSGVQQALRRNRVSGRQRRAALPSPAPRCRAMPAPGRSMR